MGIVPTFVSISYPQRNSFSFVDLISFFFFHETVRFLEKRETASKDVEDVSASLGKFDVCFAVFIGQFINKL